MFGDRRHAAPHLPDDLESQLKSYAGVVLTEDAGERILKRGPMPPVSLKSRDAVYLVRNQEAVNTYYLPGGTVNVELRSRAILGSRRVRGQRKCADDASIPNVYRHSGTHHEKILGELIDPGTANLLKSPVCIQQDPYARLKVNCIRLVQLTIKRQDLSSTFGSEASQKDAVA